MLQRKAFTEHLTRLERSLKGDYRRVRDRAFALEFFGKFYHEKKITAIAKGLEDRLGQLDEIDAMIPFAREWAPATVAWFTERRDDDRADCQRWLRKHGWTNGRAIKKLKAIEIDWLADDANRAFAATRMAESLRDLQEDCRLRVYDARKHGYRLKDVEPRVHKLRRDIRKQMQFLLFTGGLFKLEDSRRYYPELLDSAIARGPFGRLPKARLADPLRVPRDLFLVANRFIEELGNAKDWAYQLEFLRKAGCAGQIDFDQLDVRLKDWRGEPAPFNDLVRGLLAEIRRRRPFAKMAARLEEQRK